MGNMPSLSKYMMLVISLSLVTINSGAGAKEYFGRFVDVPLFTMLIGEPRTKLRLEKDFLFEDPNEFIWVSPKGAIVDGASIPPFFWPIIGAPFTGPYVYPSIIHDYYCCTKQRTAHDTHRNFYYGMRAIGVEQWRALAMYWAVVAFGPDWELTNSEKKKVSHASCLSFRREEQQSQNSTPHNKQYYRFDDIESSNLALRKFSVIIAALKATNGRYFDVSESGLVSADLNRIDRSGRIVREIFEKEVYKANPHVLGVLAEKIPDSLLSIAPWPTEIRPTIDGGILRNAPGFVIENGSHKNLPILPYIDNSEYQRRLNGLEGIPDNVNKLLQNKELFEGDIRSLDPTRKSRLEVDPYTKKLASDHREVSIPGIGKRTISGDVSGNSAVAFSNSTAEKLRWKIQSAFALENSTSGEAARYYSEIVNERSKGSIDIRLFEPGALFDTRQGWDAVRSGEVDAFWGAAALHSERIPASAFFTSVPFGADASEILAWMKFGGGKEIYNRAYAEQGMIGLHCSLITRETSGWFRNQISSIDDLMNIKTPFFGLGAKVMDKLDVSMQLLAGADISPALERGIIDATEFSMPSINLDLGFYQIAKVNYPPHLNQQSSVGELLMNLDSWNKLKKAEKSLLERSCDDAITWSFTHSLARQFEAVQMDKGKGVSYTQWSKGDLSSLEGAWNQVIAQEAASDRLFKEIYEDYSRFRSQYKVWQKKGYLDWRSNLGK